MLGIRNRCRPGTLVLALLIAVCCALPWCFAYPPGLDCPYYAYAAHVIAMGRATADCYPRDLIPTPHLLGELAAGWIARFLGPIVAVKVLMSLIPLSTAAGAYILLRTVAKPHPLWLLLVVPVVMGQLFYFGFLPVMLTIGISMVYLALCWNLSDQPWPRVALASFVGLTCYLCHAVPWECASVMIFVWGCMDIAEHRSLRVLPKYAVVAAPPLLVALVTMSFMPMIGQIDATGVVIRLTAFVSHFFRPHPGPFLVFMGALVALRFFPRDRERVASVVRDRFFWGWAVLLPLLLLHPDTPVVSGITIRIIVFVHVIGVIVVARLFTPPLSAECQLEQRQTCAVWPSVVVRCSATLALAAILITQVRLMGIERDLRRCLSSVPPAARLAIVTDLARAEGNLQKLGFMVSGDLRLEFERFSLYWYSMGRLPEGRVPMIYDMGFIYTRGATPDYEFCAMTNPKNPKPEKRRSLERVFEANDAVALLRGGGVAGVSPTIPPEFGPPLRCGDWNLYVRIGGSRSSSRGPSVP